MSDPLPAAAALQELSLFALSKTSITLRVPYLSYPQEEGCLEE